MSKPIRTGFGVKIKRVMKPSLVTNVKIPDYKIENTLVKHFKPMKKELEGKI